MPVPKGVDPKKYDDCVAQVKRKQGEKVNAYAVCASSLKKNGAKCMSSKIDMKKKLVKGLSEKFANKPLTEELKSEIREEVKKAMTAGYEDVEEAPEKVQEVNAGAPLVAPDSKAAPATESAAPAEVKTEEAPKAEPKFQNNLFKPFSLGATLKAETHGNVITGIKAPSMDYVKVEKEAIRNTKISGEDLAKLSAKPKS